MRRLAPTLAAAALLAAFAAATGTAASAAVPASAPAPLAAAAKATAKVPAFRLKLAALTTGKTLRAPLHTVTTGVIVRSPRPAAEVTFDMGQQVKNASDQYVPGRYTVRAIGAGKDEELFAQGIAFEKVLTDGKPWGRVTSGPLLAQGIYVRDRLMPGADPEAYAILLGATGTSAARVGSEKVAGTPTTHWRVTLDVPRLFNGTSVSKAQSGHLLWLFPPTVKKTSYDVWIGADGVARQFRFVMQLPAVGSTSALGYRVDVQLAPLAKGPALKAPALADVQDLTSLYAPKKG